MKYFQLGKRIMRSKGTRTKLKCSLLTFFLLCALCFFASLFAVTFFSRDVDELELRHMIKQEKDHKTINHGETGEGFVESIPFQVLSWKPRAVHFPEFATAEMCEHIIQMARDRLHPSGLALRKGETAESSKGIRTSSGSFVKASEDKAGILEVIERKIARVTMIPRNHGETFNILRYERHQKYDSHYDALSPSEYGPQKSQRLDLTRSQPGVINFRFSIYLHGDYVNCKSVAFCSLPTDLVEAFRRTSYAPITLQPHSSFSLIASFLLYLSDVDSGGDTMFPYEDGMNMNSGYDYKQCIGLKVKPRQGDGLLFYSAFPNGTIDKTSLHGSCPVVDGEKWVATKCIRDEVHEGKR